MHDWFIDELANSPPLGGDYRPYSSKINRQNYNKFEVDI